MEKWSPEWKEAQLQALQEEWESCTECHLSGKRRSVVFGEGNPDADILFVGEVPGSEENDSGRPFMGQSGDLFAACLNTAGIDIDDVYITNIVGCQPPDGRKQTTKERDTCLPRVMSIIYLVDPIVIVPMGKFALAALAKGRDWGIQGNQGNLFSSPHPSMKVVGDRNGVSVPGVVFPRTGSDKKKYHLEYDMIPVLHPNFLLREEKPDPKTKRYDNGGVTMRTIGHFKRIRTYVDEINRTHSALKIIRS